MTSKEHYERAMSAVERIADSLNRSLVSLDWPVTLRDEQILDAALAALADIAADAEHAGEESSASSYIERIRDAYSPLTSRFARIRTLMSDGRPTVMYSAPNWKASRSVADG